MSELVKQVFTVDGSKVRRTSGRVNMQILYIDRRMCVSSARREHYKTKYW